jgi:hypothetical protein
MHLDSSAVHSTSASPIWFNGGFLHWTTDFVSFYVGLGREFVPKANRECSFFIASPVLSTGAAIVYSLILWCVTTFWWPEEVALRLNALVVLRSASRGCLVRGPKKQTNKQTIVVLRLNISVRNNVQTEFICSRSLWNRLYFSYLFLTAFCCASGYCDAESKLEKFRKSKR